jgi:hypothetical protein
LNKADEQVVVQVTDFVANAAIPSIASASCIIRSRWIRTS